MHIRPVIRLHLLFCVVYWRWKKEGSRSINSTNFNMATHSEIRADNHCKRTLYLHCQKLKLTFMYNQAVCFWKFSTFSVTFYNACLKKMFSVICKACCVLLSPLYNVRVCSYSVQCTMYIHWPKLKLTFEIKHFFCVENILNFLSKLKMGTFVNYFLIIGIKVPTCALSLITRLRTESRSPVQRWTSSYPPRRSWCSTQISRWGPFKGTVYVAQLKSSYGAYWGHKLLPMIDLTFKVQVPRHN